MLGYDTYIVYCDDIVYFLNLVKRNRVSIYHLHQIGDNEYRFMASFTSRKRLKNIDFAIEYQHSNGILYFFLSFLHNKVSILGLITFVAVYAYLNLFVWAVNIEGINLVINQKLYDALENYELSIGNLKKNQLTLEEVKEQVAEDFKLDIDWLNIYLDGNTYSIKYTKKIANDVEEVSYNPIIACKAGIVDRIEAQEGNVLVKVNQYVKVGEIMIDNALITSSGDLVIIPTKGRVYGYTWKQYEASIEIENMDEAEAFSYLLERIRTAVGQDIGENGEIDKENVLQFTINEGKIVLKVHYTFYEDISCKGA